MGVIIHGEEIIVKDVNWPTRQFQRSIVIGSMEFSVTRRAVPDIGHAGTELPRNNFALVDFSSLKNHTVAIGPKMFPDVKNIPFARMTPTETYHLENLATDIGIAKAATQDSNVALPCWSLTKGHSDAWCHLLTNVTFHQPRHHHQRKLKKLNPNNNSNNNVQIKGVNNKLNPQIRQEPNNRHKDSNKFNNKGNNHNN
jgi:hypothetical protein